MIEELEQEIKTNKKIWSVYVAYQLLQEYAKEYNLNSMLTTLEDIIIKELRYYEDFETHKIKKMRKR